MFSKKASCGLANRPQECYMLNVIKRKALEKDN